MAEGRVKVFEVTLPDRLGYLGEKYKFELKGIVIQVSGSEKVSILIYFVRAVK